MCEGKLRAKWYWFARWICRVFCILFFRVRTYGQDNIPRKGPFIIVSNHQSFLDPIFCGGLIKRRSIFMARASLFTNWFFGPLIRSVNAIPVKLETWRAGYIYNEEGHRQAKGRRRRHSFSRRHPYARWQNHSVQTRPRPFIETRPCANYPGRYRWRLRMLAKTCHLRQSYIRSAGKGYGRQKTRRTPNRNSPQNANPIPNKTKQKTL